MAGGKILGENKTKEGDGVRREMGSQVEEAVPSKEEDKGLDAAKHSLAIEANPTPSSSPSTSSTTPPETSDSPMITPNPLRIIVIGDRLFTDTLLAHRLRLTLGPSNVISIHTTTLPQPDVRLLRWVESKLSRNKLREGKEDWGRHILNREVPEVEREKEKGWKRFIPFRQRYISAGEFGWRYSSWTFWGGVRGLVRTLTRSGRGMARGIRWVWSKGIAWVKARRKPIKEEVGDTVKEVEIAAAAIKT